MLELLFGLLKILHLVWWALFGGHEPPDWVYADAGQSKEPIEDER